jgi:hypothetical protein
MRWMTVPAFVPCVEICRQKMASNTGHDNFARAPSSMIERVIELVILGVYIACDTSLQMVSLTILCLESCISHSLDIRA